VTRILSRLRGTEGIKVLLSLKILLAESSHCILLLAEVISAVTSFVRYSVHTTWSRAWIQVSRWSRAEISVAWRQVLKSIVETLRA